MVSINHNREVNLSGLYAILLLSTIGNPALPLHFIGDNTAHLAKVSLSAIGFGNFEIFLCNGLCTSYWLVTHFTRKPGGNIRSPTIWESLSRSTSESYMHIANNTPHKNKQSTKYKPTPRQAIPPSVYKWKVQRWRNAIEWSISGLEIHKH